MLLMKAITLFLTLPALLYCASNITSNQKSAGSVGVPRIQKDSVDPVEVDKNIRLGQANTNEEVVKTDGAVTDLKWDDVEEAPMKPLVPNSKKNVQNNNQPKIKDTYEYSDELVLNWIRYSDAHMSASNAKKKPNGKVAFYAPPKDKGGTGEDENSTKNKQNNLLANNVKSYTGKCLVSKEYMVRGVKATALIEITCKTDDAILFEIGVELSPDNENFALLGKAKYMIDEKGNYIVLDSTKSMVRNIDGSDSNLASTVNTQAIAKFNQTAQKEFSHAMSESAKDYIEEDKAYRKKTSVAYDQYGNVIQTTNSEKPDISTNLIYGAVQGVFGVIEKTADSVKEPLPYLYAIEKGSILTVYAVPQQANATSANMGLTQTNNNQQLTNTKETK